MVSPENKIVYVTYRHLFEQFSTGSHKNPWILCIKNILDSCGFSNVWNEQTFINIKWLKAIVDQRLKDQYIQKWQSNMRDSSKGLFYSIFKTEFGFEKYLALLPKKFRTILIKLRTTNHRLPVETGRWFGIPKNDRQCNLCNNGQIADEYHYTLECKYFSECRKKYLPSKYCNRPNFFKLSELLSSADSKLLIKLCCYINRVYEKVCPP